MGTKAGGLSVSAPKVTSRMHLGALALEIARGTLVGPSISFCRTATLRQQGRRYEDDSDACQEADGRVS